ncbi:MoaD/ThiS family protein [Persephonella sp.]
MILKVKYRGKEQIIEFDKDSVTVKDILNYFGLSPEHAFVAVNGELAQEDDTVREKDNIKVINAISGG